jgi:hypothetical protein
VREFVVAKRQNAARHDRDMTLAWQIANLNCATKTKKGLPKLESLLSTATRGTKKQHPLEQIAQWQIIAARFGGQFTPLDPKTVIRG